MVTLAHPTFSLEDSASFVGRELGVSEWITVDQERIDQFAACTGDNQWLHVDVERARRESPYGAPVAHGYLSLALIAPTALEVLKAAVDARGSLTEDDLRVAAERSGLPEATVYGISTFYDDLHAPRGARHVRRGRRTRRAAARGSRPARP